VAVAPAALADALRDRYILERELGRGGDGDGLSRAHLKRKRQGALKVLDPELGPVLGVKVHA
jgi:hypothetical protein